MADAPRCMPLALSLRSWRRALLVLLAAWVLVQTVGVMHRVAHAKSSAGATVHVASDTSGVLSAIWGEHSNSTECHLFDQSCPDLLHVPTLVLLPVLPVAHGTTAVLPARLGWGERFYAARGPPVWH
jgi:hypothetical protein